MSDRIGVALDAGSDAFILLHRSAPRSTHVDWRAAMKTLIYRLTLIHRKIDDEIRGELVRRFPDSIKLLRLKKLRLAVKDRLYRRLGESRVGT